jgi:heme exporter protein A
MRLILRNITKEFNRRPVFRDISLELDDVDSLVITGKNGAGKSTLVKIISGVLSPTRGTVEFRDEQAVFSPDEVRDRIGLVSPYLQLYDEFSALENLLFLSRIRANAIRFEEESEQLLRQFRLWDKRHDHVRTFSSGMKQRLKFVFALLHRPQVLLLDEPTSNLDSEGIDVVRQVVEQQKSRNILIVATNVETEIPWCSKRLHLGGA